MKKKHTALTATRIIMLGFLVGILVGTILLSLPICWKEGQHVDVIDAFFVSVSSMCVTGLSTVNIGLTFNWFGHIVLLLLIQIGGLGVITFVAFVLIFFGKQINLSDRYLLSSAYNTDSMTGMIKLTNRIIKVSLIIELAGALCYSLAFIPEYGLTGIWYSIFHAVSCFCNAGIDILGGNSFCKYTGDVIINLTTIMLIVVSGLGFPVYWEIGRLIKSIKAKQRRSVRRMSLQAKIVLTSTAALIVLGTLLTLVFEWSNPDTLGNLSLGNKVMASLFQSVTLRTAGFATIDQGLFRNSSCMAYLVFMMIGGSPAGTAGGIKTVTFVIVLAAMIANIKNNSNVNLFNRKISDDIVRRCLAILTFSLSVLIVLTVALLFVFDADFMSVLYEMTSAVGTVGLSRGITGSLPFAGKIILCIAMYLGRIGPITLALAFSYKNTSEVEYMESKIIVG